MSKEFPWKKKRGSFGGSLSLHIFIWNTNINKHPQINEPLSLSHAHNPEPNLSQKASLLPKICFFYKERCPKRDRKSTCLDLSLSQTFFLFFCFFFCLIRGPTPGLLLVQCLYQLLSPQGTMEWQPQYTLICSRFRFL